MGAGFLLSYLPKCELTDARKAALFAAVYALPTEALLDVANNCGVDEGEDEANATYARNGLFNAINEYQNLDGRRDTGSIRPYGLPYMLLVTGGMSWGDSPTECSDTFDWMMERNELLLQLLEWAAEDSAELDVEYENVFVDVPDPNNIGIDDAEWRNIHNFTTKGQAVGWIRDNIGPCDLDGNICLITLGNRKE